MGDIFSWFWAVFLDFLNLVIAVVLIGIIAGCAIWVRDSQHWHERTAITIVWLFITTTVFLGFSVSGIGFWISAVFVVTASLFGFFFQNIISFFFGKWPSSF